jgi:hypothetical protein
MFPWKDFLMRWIRKIQRHKGKGCIRKNFKNKKEKNGGKKKKRFFFTNVEVPILACSPLGRNALKLSTLCNPPSLVKTHSYRNFPCNPLHLGVYLQMHLKKLWRFFMLTLDLEIFDLALL